MFKNLFLDKFLRADISAFLVIEVISTSSIFLVRICSKLLYSLLGITTKSSSLNKFLGIVNVAIL